jgi:hypothetical protein
MSIPDTFQSKKKAQKKSTHVKVGGVELPGQVLPRIEQDDVRPVVEVREREPLPHDRRVQLVVGVPVRQALRSPINARAIVCAVVCDQFMAYRANNKFNA